jgi:hypothetical protein
VTVFRFFVKIISVALVAAAVYFFLIIEKKSERLNADMLKGQAIYSEITESNNEDLLRFKAWLAYKENWEKEPKVQAYLFLKELDETYIEKHVETYIPGISLGGKASLGICSLLVLLFAMLLCMLTKTKTDAKPKPAARNTSYRDTYRDTERNTYAEQPRTEKLNAAASGKPKPDAQALLRKAAKCAENEPMQAISYLEQALEESLGSKLSVSALLLCGSLRLKNKIGEEQGREQLRKVISESPNSSEAKKAKVVLDTF